MEVTSQHHQPIKFNFTRFLGTRVFDAMLNHSPVRFTLHFGAKFFLNASIASEAFDSSYQLKRPLMACNVQSTAKFIQSNWSASIKIASQIMTETGCPKCFRNSEALVTLLLLLLHLIVTHSFSEDCHILLAQSVAFFRLRNFFNRAFLCVRFTRSVRTDDTSVGSSVSAASYSTAPSLKNLISSHFIAQKLFVQLPSELTLITLVALTSLGDREGFGVGDGCGCWRAPSAPVTFARFLLFTSARVLAAASFNAVEHNSAHWFF